MTTSGPGATFRHVADGSSLPGLHRVALVPLRSPRALAVLVLVGLALGVWAAAVSIDRPGSHLGAVLYAGVVWGLLWTVAVASVVLLLVVPVALVLNRRTVRRQFPSGSVTEVELGRDALVLRRPTGFSAVPYRSIYKVREIGPLLRIEVRGRTRAELLPLGLLPAEAIGFLRAKARGTWPVLVPEGSGEPTRQLVVPTGWAGHVAAVRTRELASDTAFWLRLTLVLLLSLPLTWLGGPWWAATAPVAGLVALGLTYAQTRRIIARAQPTGSLASTDFLADRYVSRSVGGVREVRYADIRSLDFRGDVALVRLVHTPGPLLMARALIPDEVLERLPG